MSDELPENLILRILEKDKGISREELWKQAKLLNNNPKVKFNRYGYSEEIEEAIDNLLFAGKITPMNEGYSLL